MCGISLSMPEVCAVGKNGPEFKSEPFCDEPKGHRGPHGCFALDAAWWDTLGQIQAWAEKQSRASALEADKEA